MSKPWRTLRSALAGVAFSAAGAAAVETDPYVSGDATIYVAYRFGAGGGLELGLQGRVTYGLHNNCGSDTFFGAGMASVGWVIAHGPRVTAGGSAGRLFGETWTLAGELALGYEWGKSPGLGILVGAEGGLSVLPVRFDYDVPRQDAWIAAGVRVPPPSGTCVQIGRPQHDAAPAAVVVTRAPAAGSPASVWLERARGEWASVPAFIELAQQLAAAGAPRPLVARAWRAAEEEVVHAALSAQLAADHGAPVLALEAQLSRRGPLAGAAGLLRLARESWLDGCLGEGAAAACAAAEQTSAAGARTRETQARIAVDEAGHAALAWDTLAWATARGGDDVRHEVWRLREETPPAAEVPTDARLAHAGILAAADRDDVLDAHHATARTRLQRVLSATAS